MKKAWLSVPLPLPYVNKAGTLNGPASMCGHAMRACHGCQGSGRRRQHRRRRQAGDRLRRQRARGGRQPWHWQLVIRRPLPHNAGQD